MDPDANSDPDPDADPNPDADPDPAISFFVYCFLKVHLHHLSKLKSHKEVTKQQKSLFFLLFCLMMEGSASGFGSGSVSLTYGSGCGCWRPKNKWILEAQKQMDPGDPDPQSSAIISNSESESGILRGPHRIRIRETNQLIITQYRDLIYSIHVTSR
jgi:hypothetical protein